MIATRYGDSTPLLPSGPALAPAGPDPRGLCANSRAHCAPSDCHPLANGHIFANGHTAVLADPIADDRAYPNCVYQPCGDRRC